MPTYKILDKNSLAEITRYSASAPTAASGFSITEYTHEEVLEVDGIEIIPESNINRLTKYQFIKRLGIEVYGAILSISKTDASVEVWLELFKTLTPDPDGTSIDLADIDTINGLHQLEQILISYNIVINGWAEGVLNG